MPSNTTRHDLGQVIANAGIGGIKRNDWRRPVILSVSTQGTSGDAGRPFFRLRFGPGVISRPVRPHWPGHRPWLLRLFSRPGCSSVSRR
ncbi:hypothetical protein ALP32_104058 [Pseudomonas avellanae]|uniref:Uncharacterized protein n=1 Tax=Pseudomonas avellanae TaxID=46257 RepID=A0A3M5TVP7_9PSED|nr:hypothetical protein ALP32_104058 [Pseudomonas avellanae]